MKKNYLISSILVLFFFIAGQAQRNYDNEILVFFAHDVIIDKEIENDKNVVSLDLFNDKMKSSLNKIDITSNMIERALPEFKQSDTLVILDSGERFRQPNMTLLYRISVPEDKSRERMIEDLEKLPEVLFAEPNGTIQPFASPDDEYFDQQWGLKNKVTPGADIHAEGAWDIYTGNSNNIIAIVDYGINKHHEDLKNKILGGDNGYSSTRPHHGTGVAGVAAAESNNIGISGVDWRARIHSKRMDNHVDDIGVYEAIIDAVNYSSNLHVLNHSWGLIYSDGSPRYSSIVRMAFAYAYKANRTSVVAMGEPYNGQHFVAFPAGFENVIAVGATDNKDIISELSAQGPHIDVCAPGVGILTTTNTNTGYNSMSGTSLATPFVSGIASLLKGYNSSLANDDIEYIIKLSADEINGPGFDFVYGHGRVNAESALKYLQAPYTLSQLYTSSGTSLSTTEPYLMTIIGAQGLSDAPYIVKRHEVVKTVNTPNQFLHIEGIWGRGVSTKGWNIDNTTANFTEGFCEVVPGSQQDGSVKLRTYVYEVRHPFKKGFTYYPATPSGVTFAYSILGVLAPTIEGSPTICTSGTTYTLEGDLPDGATVNWAKSSNVQVISSGPDYITVKPIGSGNGWVQASITSIYGEYTSPKKTFSSGMPPIPWNIMGFCCNGMEFGSETIYNFTVNHDNNAGINNYNWVINGATILSGQGTNTVTVKTMKVTGSQIGHLNVSVRVGNDCGWSDFFQRTGKIVSGTGATNFTVYPNPTSADQLVVSVANDGELHKNAEEPMLIDHIRIYDLNGILKKVNKSNSPEKSTVINISDLKTGSYLIFISNGVTEESHKLIVE